MLWPMTSSAQDHSRFLQWSYQDVIAAVESAKSRDALIAGGAALFVAGGSYVDEDILEAIRERWDGTEPILDIANHLGDAEVVIPLAGLFGVSLLTESTRFQDAAFTSLQSAVYASGATLALKVAIGRGRPDLGEGPRSFDPFSGNRSLPSGHTTFVFAMVTPWVYYYPHPVTYTLLGAVTLTGVARMALNKHWPTDVVVGAGIGFLTGRFLSRQHKRSSREQALSIIPQIGFDQVGIRMMVRLD